MASQGCEKAELLRLREELDKSSMEKELLRWEKAQVEAKLERLEGTEDKLDLGDLAEVKTPRRPGENVGKSHYEAVDSESKIQSPTVNAYMCQEETSGYLSQDSTAPKLDERYSPLYEPQQMKMSTPFAPKRQEPTTGTPGGNPFYSPPVIEEEPLLHLHDSPPRRRCE